jgi:subtilisin family serine protease
MANISLYLYRSVEFDGNIYLKGIGFKERCTIELWKDGKLHITLPDVSFFNYPFVYNFKNQTIGSYQVVLQFSGATDVYYSNTINITSKSKEKPIVSPDTYQKTEIVHRKYNNISKYYLYIKLQDNIPINTLSDEPEYNVPTFYIHKETAIYESLPLNTINNDSFEDTYIIRINTDFEVLVKIADELNKLDYVVYCFVSPDTTNMPPPELPLVETPFDLTDDTEIASTTPDFTGYQRYLRPDGQNRGMNVLAVWERGEVGRAATVRHLDFGVYQNHEDLKGNITVVHSRPETEDCNHGTASTGCIAAIDNGFGVTGIAHGCSYYFYDTGDMYRIVDDATPGDIISFDVQFGYGDKLLPAIALRNWWDVIYDLATRKRVVVILAAGNGGLDLSIEAGNMPQYGDSGSSLIGACNTYFDGSNRLAFSNYNHSTSLMNSWGYLVTTTGYGDLQTAGIDRNYTRSYSGTSSATPLCSGALALVQSYAIANFGIYLNSWEMRELIAETGYTDGVAGKIGWRPNVDAAISALDQRFGNP